MIKYANKKVVHDMFVALEKSAHLLQMEKNAWGWNDIKQGVSGAANAVGQGVNNFVTGVQNAAQGTRDAAKNFMTGAQNATRDARDTAKNYLQQGAQNIKQVGQNIADDASAQFQRNVDALSNTGQMIGNAVTGNFDQAAQNFQQIKPDFNQMGSNIRKGFNRTVDNLSNVGKSIGNVAAAAGTMAAAPFTSIPGGGIRNMVQPGSR